MTQSHLLWKTFVKRFFSQAPLNQLFNLAGYLPKKPIIDIAANYTASS